MVYSLKSFKYELDLGDFSFVLKRTTLGGIGILYNFQKLKIQRVEKHD